MTDWVAEHYRQASEETTLPYILLPRVRVVVVETRYPHKLVQLSNFVLMVDKLIPATFWHPGNWPRTFTIMKDRRGPPGAEMIFSHPEDFRLYFL